MKREWQEFTPDEIRIAQEYHHLMNPERKPRDVPMFFFLFTVHLVQMARKEEPRINCGGHFLDWTQICDDDDTIDSFYGEDYFEVNK